MSERTRPSLSIFMQVPKSANFTCPRASNNMLSGFTSRCTYLEKEREGKSSSPLREKNGGRERSEQSGASERVSGVSEQANGRASGPVLTSRFLFVPDHSAMATFEGWIKIQHGDGGEENGGNGGEGGVSDGGGESGGDGLHFEIDEATISRLDRYGKSSECVVQRKPSIKHLCFCKNFLRPKIDIDEGKFLESLQKRKRNDD